MQRYPPGKPAVHLPGDSAHGYASGFAYNTNWPGRTKVCGGAFDLNGKRAPGYPCVTLD